MRRWIHTLTTLLLAAHGAGCSGGRVGLQHPLTNELNPVYAELNVRTLAVMPFASDVGEREDPDRIAGPMVESTFYASLQRGTGFSLLPSSEVGRAVEHAGLTRDMDDFYKDWLNDQENVDEEFVRAVAEMMQVDAVVAGAVDVWYQKEIDITESGTAKTHVGVLVGLFDGKTGKRLWLARDENSKDALRYSGAGNMQQQQVTRDLERSNQRTAGGVYAPPDYREVVPLVVDAIVSAFPASGR